MKKELASLFIIFSTFLLGFYVAIPTVKIDHTNYIVKTVKSGDSLWTIASDITPEQVDIRDMISEICTLNNISDVSKITPGTIIKIPTVKNVQNQVPLGFDMAQN